MADRKLVAIFDAVMTPWQRAMYEASQSQRKWEVASLSSFGRVEKGLGGLMVSASRLSAVSAVLAGGFGAGMATRFLDQAARIHNALKQIGSDNQDTFDKVYLASNRALIGMDDFTSSVMRIQKVMGEKQSIDVAIRQMETLNKLMATGGKTTSERASTMRQFSQAMQKGILNSDELPSLRENAPVELLREMARLTGGTIDDLAALAASGKITRDIMAEALNNMAVDADTAMSKIQVTIGAAAEVMRNGAIRAAEGFDKGLGFSRVTVQTLKSMGALLGSNAENARLLGAALNALIPLLAAAFIARRVNKAGASLFVDGPAERAQILATAKVAQASAETALVNAGMKVRAGQLQINALRLEGASVAKLAAAYKGLEVAQATMAIAAGRVTVTTNAAATAQARMAFTTRALTAAGSALNSAWAFLGGWPGLLLLAGTALLTMKSNARQMADVIAEAETAISSTKSAVSELADLQDRLNMLIVQSGGASDSAHQAIMANLVAELAAKGQLLRLENERLQALYDEGKIAKGNKQADLLSAQRDVAQAKATIASLAARGFPETSEANIQAIELLRVSEAAVITLTDEVSRLTAQWTLTALQLNANHKAIESTGALLAQISGLAVFEKAVDGAQVLSGWLDSVSGQLDGIGNAKIPDPFGSMIAGAKQLVGWLVAAARGFGNLGAKGTTFGGDPRVDLPVGSMPKAPGVPLSSPTPPNRPWWEPAIGGAATSGGGSGGGSTSANKDDEEALRIIESMMTAEEKRASEMTNMLALRGRLAATYGEESDLVKRLDEAIQRTTDSLQTANDELTQFFDTMSNEIANNILEWKGWDNFLRSTLANLVRQFGPEFFTAIFTPGAQTGGGLGTTIGNLVTGGKSSLPAAALSGRIRAPAGARMASSTINIVHHNDFRGADPSMKVWVEGQLTKRDREFHPRVVNANRNARSKRELQ